MKKYVMPIAAFIIITFSFCLSANACEVLSDVVDNGTRYVTISANGLEDDGPKIRSIINECEDNPLVLTLLPGDYHLYSTIALYSNTTINATGASIYQLSDGKGILINARRLDGVSQGKGGYKSIKNILIKGGNWICTSQPDVTKIFKNTGYYVGYSTFLFMHGENITVDSASFKNNYNGHFIEFAGVNKGKIINCNMNVKDSKYVGENSNEAIQIDNTYAKANSPVGAPWDDTPCKNITVKNCDIRFARGIGTNRIGNSFFEKITIQNCEIISDCEGINIYDTLGLDIKNCNIKSMGKKNNYTSCAIYIGLDSKLSAKNRKKSITKLTGNTTYGCHAGVKICIPANNTKFGTIELKKNKFYSSKSKKYALRLSYNGKQISKFVSKNNTLKKKG